MKKKIISLYGQPGSGKTTQADLLLSEFGFSKFGMGERLREEIESKSELGASIKPYVDKGVLIPDEYMAKIITHAEKISSEKGIIFDGFPRIISQGEMLDEIMSSLDLEISAFVHLRLSPEEALRRIKERSKVDFSRSDDIDEDAIRNRFEVFARESISLIEFYRKRNLLIEIDGEQTIEEINKELVEKLGL